MAESARAQTLFADDFARPDSTTVGNGWSESEQDASAEARVANGRLRLDSLDDPVEPAVTNRFTRVTSGRLEWSYRFEWDRTGSESRYSVRMQLGDSGALRHPLQSATAGVAVDLEWTAVTDDDELEHETLTAVSGGTTRTVANVSGATTIRATVDLDAGTYAVDVNPSDGRVEATGVRLPSAAAIDTVRLFVDSVNGSKFGGRAFDGLAVTRLDAAPPPEPEPDEDPAPAPGTHTLTAEGDRFLLDGTPFDMWGIRTASATATDAQSDHLIAQLDAYRAHRVNTVTVFYQGSRSANYDPFTSDGRSVDAGHQGRMERIIEAADQRGMVVVVGIFYQRATLRLRDAAAVREAVRTVARELKPYRNVVINIANEQNSTAWDDTRSIFDFRDPQRIIELCRIVHEVDPDRLVGGGGYDPSRNKTIGSSPDVDVMLFDTNGATGDSGDVSDALVSGGVRNKPLANVEALGGWTLQHPRGVFSDSVKREYYEEIAAADALPELSVFFHSSPWTQTLPMRFDLAGSGSSSSPGIRWWFERVRSVTSG